MDLSHQSITGRQFELNRRGYDPDAVDAHLGEIASAVAEQESKRSEMERTIAALEAKVQDANESEEALRLTLKAAAHAKEELLAGAREQAETTQREADERAGQVVADAEQRAAAITAEAQAQADSVTSEAQAQADAVTSGAAASAQEVASAALAESEFLVARIEELRNQVGAAEEALRALHAEANPRLEGARATLDEALQQARETAENPELLARAMPAPAAEPEQPEEPVAEHSQTVPSAEAAHAEPEYSAAPAPGEVEQVASQEPMETEHHAAQAVAEEPSPDHVEPPVADEGAVQDAGEHSGEDQPHLEVVAQSEEQEEAPAESTADISDKVDRLLEELREVT